MQYTSGPQRSLAKRHSTIAYIWPQDRTIVVYIGETPGLLYVDMIGLDVM